MPIHLLELYAVIIAIKKAPQCCNLRIACDNQTIIFGIPRGGKDNEQLINMIEKLNSTASRRSITVVIHYTRTENN